MDFYGRKLATCSSDRLIKVYDFAAGTGPDGQPTQSEEPVLSAELGG